MAEKDPTEPPTEAEPWIAFEPTTSTGQVMGGRVHTGQATFPEEPTRRAAEHIRLLGILSYIYGGLQGLGVLFGLLYVGLGLVFIFNPPPQGASQASQPPPEFLGWMFTGIGAFVVVLSGTLMTLTLISARDLMRHRRRVFCIVVAATHCLNIPLGMVLGIFTMIVLNKPEAKALFERNAKQ